MVPNGWKHIRLDSIAETVTSGSRDWAKYYSEKGSKFIRMTNLPRDGIYLKLGDLKYVDVKSNSSDGKRTSLKAGDLLISITAELGKIGWVPEGLGVAYINQHTALVRLKESKSDSKFIAYLLSSKTMNHKINRLNDSGAKAGLNLPTIRSIPFDLPPLPEQQKIAKILSTWDKAISTTEALIDNSKQQKKALMQQLLTGKKRFAGFEGKWEDKHLEELTSKISDGIHTTPVYTQDSEIFFVNGNNLKNGAIVVNKLTKKVCPNNAKKHSRKLSDRTLLMSINGTIGNLAYYKGESVVLGKSACYINVDPKIDINFIYYFLKSRKTQAFYVTELTGSTIKNLSLKTIKSTKVLLPSLPEQQKIASVLTKSDKEIDILEQQLTDLKQEKKALMQQLLTGKRRVKIDKCEAALS